MLHCGAAGYSLSVPCHLEADAGAGTVGTSMKGGSEEGGVCGAGSICYLCTGHTMVPLSESIQGAVSEVLQRVLAACGVSHANQHDP